MCLLHALRYFRREQFLILRYEDLMKLDANSLVWLLGHFTGLHVSESAVRSSAGVGRNGGKCQASRNRKPNSYSSSSPYGAEMLAAASPGERNRRVAATWPATQPPRSRHVALTCPPRVRHVSAAPSPKHKQMPIE